MRTAAEIAHELKVDQTLEMLHGNLRVFRKDKPLTRETAAELVDELEAQEHRLSAEAEPLGISVEDLRARLLAFVAKKLG